MSSILDKVRSLPQQHRWPAATAIGVAVWGAGAVAITLVVTLLLLVVWFPATCVTPPHGVIRAEWERWPFSPYGWTVACASMALTVVWARSLKQPALLVIAWLSLVWQAQQWHALLTTVDWCT